MIFCRYFITILILFALAGKSVFSQHYPDWTGFGFVQQYHPVWGTLLFNELTEDYTIDLTSFFTDPEKLPDGYSGESEYYFNWAKDSLQPCDWDFLQLERGGILTIKKGYRWDGATNGVTDRVYNHRSSLLHDALYDLMRLYYLLPDEFERGDPLDADNPGDHNREMADIIYYMISIEDGDSRSEAESDFFWIRTAGWIGTTFNEYQLKPWKFHISCLCAYLMEGHILLEWKISDQYLTNPDPIECEGYYILRDGICIDTISGIENSYCDFAISENEFHSYQLIPVNTSGNIYDWSNVEFIATAIDQDKILILDGIDDVFKSITVCNDLYSDTLHAGSISNSNFFFYLKFQPQFQTGINSLFSIYSLDGNGLIELIYNGDQESLTYSDTLNGEIMISDNVSVNQWHTIGVIADSTNQLTFIFDGNTISNFNSAVRPSRGSILFLGNSRNNERYGYFQGLVRELTIWKKVFSPLMFSTLADMHLTGREKDLIGYWNFQEPKDHSSVVYWGNEINGNIKRAYDGSGYGNDAILEGYYHETDINTPQQPGNSLKFKTYPNPFISETTIEYYLRDYCSVSISIFHANGNMVFKQISEMDAGTHKLNWDSFGLPSGVYYCKIQTAETVEVSKLILSE